MIPFKPLIDKGFRRFSFLDREIKGQETARDDTSTKALRGTVVNGKCLPLIVITLTVPLSLIR